MPYFSKQKFDIRELAELPRKPKLVLLIISEESLGEIYARQLERHGFEVVACPFGDILSMGEGLKRANVLIVDFLDSAEKHKLEFLKLAVRDFPALSVITIGHGLDEESLRLLMSLGVVGHLERKFSQPQDLVEITKTILF